MEFRAGSVRIHIHPLMLLFPLLAGRLSPGHGPVSFMISLAVHEAAHVIAARCAGSHIDRITLMPFGGSAHLSNPYALSAFQLMVTSAAGPAANLALIVLCAAMAHWGWLSPPPVLRMMQINLMMMLFNLLPALPLDGGRILYAALFPRLGRRRAMTAGLAAGQILAALLIAGAVFTIIKQHVINISFIFAAIFILAAAADERRALSDTRAQTILNSLKPLTRPVPARLYAVSEVCTASAALKAAGPDSLTLYAVYSHKRFKGFTDDHTLLTSILETGAETTVLAAMEKAHTKTPTV